MRAYYVTVIRGKRIGWLYGPCNFKHDALDKVATCSKLAREIDPWCDFDAFGVTAIESDKKLPDGKLNHILQLSA